MRVRWKAILVLTLGTMLAAAALGPPAEAGGGTLEPLTIVTGAGALALVVEIASTPAERATGLMYRIGLAPNRGMFFDFGITRPVAMWMKNTLISLDMFFVDPSGRIVTIAERTTPLSEQRIGSRVPVRFVLELAGGSAARLGIGLGDLLRHPRLDRLGFQAGD